MLGALSVVCALVAALACIGALALIATYMALLLPFPVAPQRRVSHRDPLNPLTGFRIWTEGFVTDEDRERYANDAEYRAEARRATRSIASKLLLRKALPCLLVSFTLSIGFKALQLHL